MAVSRTFACVLVLVILVVGFAVGFLAGYFVQKDRGSSDEKLEKLTADGDKEITAKLLAEVKPENIREYLRELTRHPHLAGTPADKQQAEELKKFWEDQGLDHVKITPFRVLLSYPEKDDPNRIVLYDENDHAVHTSQLEEKILSPDQNQSDVVPPFNAYSASGTPEGDLVYVNYGRIEDFQWLTEVKGINITGKICIARYGKIFRGDKARQAEKFGASGLVLFSDPEQYSVEGISSVFPDTWWLPPSGVQRGNVKVSSGGLGDPLTPGYPALESAFRLKEEDASLPRIPVHPIGYGDAKMFLQDIDGEDAPEDWQGKLPIKYKLGPGFKQSGWKLKMHISTHNQMATTYNVHGIIKGSVEPDRYVMLGNHRDAWVFGAVDPSSGTASMKEASRVLGKLVREGWRPRRSIMFCSWGAEEHGIIGSREWVEYYGKLIGDRAVAYINVDIAVQGNYTFRGNGLPLVFNAMYETAKKIPNVDTEEYEKGRKTMFDTWLKRWPESGDNPTKPRISLLGSGSDYTAFITKVGVTCVDLRYHYDSPRLGLSSYPLYHSVYETFHLMDQIMDPDYRYHKAVTQYWLELARNLADSHLLPFDVTEYTDVITKSVKLIKDQYEQLMKDSGLEEGLNFLDEAVGKFRAAADAFQGRLPDIDKENPVEVRMVNDQMMKLSRMFIDPLGLPGRPLTRNVIFAPSQHNSYAGASFPGLVDSLFDIDKVSDTDEEYEGRWTVVKQQLASITFFVDAAATWLSETQQI